MAQYKTSPAKRWLQAFRILQIIALLVLSALLIYAIAKVNTLASSYADVLSPAALRTSLAVLSVDFIFNLFALALCITWCVFTASPAQRARASCCGNRRICMYYACDISWDIVFAVLYLVSLILGIISKDAIAIAGNVVMLSLFVATAFLSVRLRRFTKQSAADTAENNMLTAPKSVAMV